MNDGPAWLPGHSGADSWVTGQTVVGASFTVPRLSGVEARAIADRTTRAALAARRTHRIADVILAASRAALRLADPDDTVGAAAVDALQLSGGWSRHSAQELLAQNAAGWTAMCLASIVSDELGNPALLDAPQDDPERPGRRRQAIGPPALLVILAGNVPGVSVTAVLRGLLVRSAVLCKVSRHEPDLVGLFARALAEEDEALGNTIAATWWPAEEFSPTAAEWTKRSGKVIVYGGSDAVRSIRARTPPETPLLEYGPRLGLVLLGPDVSDADLEGLARDVCAYDQAGCVSPRLVYLLGDPSAWDPLDGPDAPIRRLARALSDRVAASPGTRLTDAEAIAIRAARARYQFAGEDGSLALGAEDLSWTILCRDDVDSYSEVLPRTIWAYRIGAVDDLRELGPLLGGRVQAVGVAGIDATARREIEQLAVEWRVSRVSPVGEMAWPPFDWRHDGRLQLLPLLNWTDFE